MKVYIAADHAGFELKNILVPFVRELGHVVEDCGAHILDPNDDYPGIVRSACKRLVGDVIEGYDNRAIVIGASGQGEAIVANRFKGVRCALFYGDIGREQTDMSGKKLSILLSPRQHQDANCLSLGARFLTHDEAQHAVKEWLETPFVREERHVRRIWQIDAT